MEAPEYLDLDEIDFSDDAVVSFKDKPADQIMQNSNSALNFFVIFWVLNLQFKMCVRKEFPQAFSWSFDLPIFRFQSLHALHRVLMELTHL